MGVPATEGTTERRATIPFPVVGWTDVLKADDPIREPTRGRLRELRKKEWVPNGVTVWNRGPRSLQGRSTYYSVLAALALRSRRLGHDDDASGLGEAASLVEERFRESLAAFLTDHALSELPGADFFDELATATANGLADRSGLAHTLFAAAQVEDIRGDVARLVGKSPFGEPIMFDLPQLLLDRQFLGVGDLVWVFSGVVGNAVLVELLPAIRMQLKPDISFLPYELVVLFDVDDPHRQGIDDDGFTDEERAEAAQRFREGVGADLSPEDIAAIRAESEAGLIPVRRIYPTG